MKIDDTLQQITDLLKSGSIKKLLITSGKNDDPDAVGSVLALADGLQGIIPEIVLAIEDFDPSTYQFLPDAARISNIVGQKSLIVSIDVGASPIDKINYNTHDTKFNLVLTPKSGQVDVDQIEYSYSGVSYDAIIVVDTAKKELLGDWVQNFEEELKDTPIINLDHHQDNSLFGTLNFIQPTPSATMVVHQVLQALEVPITAPMANYLLAGLLSDTSAFANSNANAASMRIAAQWVDDGANLNQLMVGLFRTMSLATMRLWGKVLSNLQVVEPGILLAQLSQEDIALTQANESDISTLSTLLNNVLVSDHTMQVAVLLKDKGNAEVSGSLRAVDEVNVADLAKQFGGGGHIKAAGFKLTDTTLDQAVKQVSESLQQQLTNTAGQPKTSNSDNN